MCEARRRSAECLAPIVEGREPQALSREPTTSRYERCTSNLEPRTPNEEGPLMAETVWIFGKDT